MIETTRKTSLNIKREDISLTDSQILNRYLGISKFPCSICSPLRDDDNTPSFSMIERGDVVFWKDFGTGEKGNAISLMAAIWNVTYSEALLKIKLDTENKIPKISLIRKYKGKIHLTNNSEIKVKIREFKDYDLEFWKSFGISKKMLKFSNVYAISHMFFYKDKKEICVPADKYAYAYFEWKDDKESIKIYQPYSQTIKWLSKHDSSVWDLWQQAFTFGKKNNDNIIITSSRKDAMCLWENLSVPAVSLQGEGYIPKPHVMQQVLDSFKNVYIWYDNDFGKEHNVGQEHAKNLINLYPSIINIVIPDIYKSKDPSDLVKNHSVKILKEIWTKKLEKTQ